MPSNNPGSLQVIKTCEALLNLNNHVELITPNTGLNISVKKFYNLKNVPIINKINFFKKFPIGINYYFFSIFAVIYCIKSNFDFIITRNPFTLFILMLFKKKAIIEFHHDLSIESRIVRFIFYNFNILNNKKIIKIIAITKNVKEFLINDLQVNSSKIEIIPSASDLKFKFDILKTKKKT